MKEEKTNAMRILDSMKIPYDVKVYEYDVNNLDAMHLSLSAGLNPDEVFKTIVMITNTNALYVFVTPAEAEISLKKARNLTGAKEITLLKTDLLLKYTGYIRGGCSPIGMIRKYPTFIEETAFLSEKVYVSAGVRGKMIRLSPEDLTRASGAETAEFI